MQVKGKRNGVPPVRRLGATVATPSLIGEIKIFRT
jgi:hypothetical protein